MENNDSPEKKSGVLHFRRNIIAGGLALFPLYVTWIVFTFVLRLLSDAGEPIVIAAANALSPYYPPAAEVFSSPIFQSVLAILITILSFYFLGVLTTRVLGRKLFQLLEKVIERIPFAQNIYGATKKLLHVLRGDQEKNIQRVVLIDFPSNSLKTVGFVTATMRDQNTGRELAAVYVPTTPNPTSGYLEIVPVDRLTQTNWKLDEAMTFVMSGGAVAPKEIPFE